MAAPNTNPNPANMKYTQKIDPKTGEISYVPETPPQGQGDGKSKNKSGSGGDKQYNPKSTQAASKELLGNNHDYELNERILQDIETDYSIFGNNGRRLDFKPDNKLTKALEALEVNNKKLRYDRRLLSGKLDGRRLVAHKTSERLFKKKAIKHRDYQFTLLVDTSGSMFDSKITTAISSVSKIVQSLEQLNIPVAVWAMNNAVVLVKDYRETYDETDVMNRFKFSMSGQVKSDDDAVFAGGTSEYVAYEEALERAKANSTHKTKNVAIVLSDGAPGCRNEYTPVFADGKVTEYKTEYSRHTGAYQPSANRTDSLRTWWERRKFEIEAYGIGLYSDARQVTNAKSINNIKQLPEVMNNLIQNIMF